MMFRRFTPIAPGEEKIIACDDEARENNRSDANDHRKQGILDMEQLHRHDTE